MQSLLKQIASITVRIIDRPIYMYTTFNCLQKQMLYIDKYGQYRVSCAEIRNNSQLGHIILGHITLGHIILYNLLQTKITIGQKEPT